MYAIAKRFKFDAAHQLLGLAEGHKCGNLHGHTYTIEVALLSQNLSPEGFVVDFNDMKPIKEYIDSKLDHKFLNDVFGFQTTSENIACHLFYKVGLLMDLPDGVIVSHVKVSETESTYAIFTGEMFN